MVDISKNFGKCQECLSSLLINLTHPENDQATKSAQLMSHLAHFEVNFFHLQLHFAHLVVNLAHLEINWVQLDKILSTITVNMVYTQIITT